MSLEPKPRSPHTTGACGINDAHSEEDHVHTYIAGRGCMSTCQCGKSFSDPIHGQQSKHLRDLREAAMKM